MSTQENVVSPVVSSDPTSSHVETAQARLQELRLMRDLIPRFTIPASPKATARLNAVASVAPEFVELTAVAITNEKSLVREGGASPAELRDLMSYSDAYNPLADELEALAQFIRHSAAAARNKAGSEALAIYAIAQRLAKLPETAGLAPYVADMRRALGRARKLTAEALAKKAKKAEKTPPAPPVTTKPS